VSLTLGRRRGRPPKGIDTLTPKVHLQGYVPDHDGSVSRWLKEYSKVKGCKSEGDLLAAIITEIIAVYCQQGAT
jgi:hypothetical protein